MKRILSNSDLLKLTRWNTPTVYNGWEAITTLDRVGPYYNTEEVKDFMPQMGVMVGYATTVVVEPSNPIHKENKNAGADYRSYLGTIDGPTIAVVQDLDKPKTIGSFWGEVGANIHKALGCVGTITDGAIRDVDEMTNAGFHAIARRLCVGHAHVIPVKWNCEVEVFGVKVRPGDLIHADKHGFLIIPPQDQERLLEALLFMDNNECETIIPSTYNTEYVSKEKIVEKINKGAAEFAKKMQEKFSAEGEW